MRPLRVWALALLGVTLALAASACGSKPAAPSPVQGSNPPAGNVVSTGAAGNAASRRILVDLTLSGDINTHLTGSAGDCEQERYAFSGDEVGAEKNFTFEIQIDDKPKLAMNVDGESYFTYQRGAEGTFDITPGMVTLDLDVRNFSAGMVHMKGSLTCGA